MSDTPPSVLPPYEEVLSAPVVYFDIIGCNGIMAGAIQIELAQRILTPSADGGVNAKFATSGRLRCSPAAAQNLIAALQNSLQMLEQPANSTAAAATKLN